MVRKETVDHHCPGKKVLDDLYRTYNRRRYVHPDPLEFLYAYPALEDREIVALAAASLAYGRVAQILNSVARVLDPMAPGPRTFLASASLDDLRRTYGGFVHRFATGDHVAALLFGAKNLVARYGSLYEGFLRGLDPGAETVLDALAHFALRLTENLDPGPGHLLPMPNKGSAVKRLNLFLRWMVRKDAVDPGGWGGVDPRLLIVPLDTHMHRIGQRFGFTRRRQADMRTAMEITAGFRGLAPEDPVRYDFSLTRLGIRNDLPVPAWYGGDA